MNSLLAMPVQGGCEKAACQGMNTTGRSPLTPQHHLGLLSIQFHPVFVIPLKSPTLLEGCLCLSWPPSCSPCCQWQQARDMRSAQPPTPPICVPLPVCMGLRDHQGLLGGMGGTGGMARMDGIAAQMVRQLELIWRTSERLFD